MEQQLRRHPSYIQQTRGTLKKKLTLFIGYYRYIGIVKKLLMHYSCLHPSNAVDGEEALNQVVVDEDDGYFEEPNYQSIGLLEKEVRDSLLKDLVKVVCDAYDTEWWYIILQRAILLQRKGDWNREIVYPREKKDFPRTKSEYQKYLTLLGGNSFMSMSEAFSMGQATVKEKSAITTMMIRDLTNKLSPDSKSRWTQMVTRHVSHYIIEEML